jgi:hypothetical protein
MLVRLTEFWFFYLWGLFLANSMLRMGKCIIILGRFYSIDINLIFCLLVRYLSIYKAFTRIYEALCEGLCNQTFSQVF